MARPNLMQNDLKRSGLTAATIRKLKVKLISKNKKDKVNIEKITDGKFFDILSYKIPYFDIKGAVTDFYRIRFLEPPHQKGFFKNSDRKPLRYWQPACTKPMLYFPPVVDWASLAKMPHIDLYITEGEKKAAAACQFGFPCIGLGGVWSWRSKALKQAILAEFKQIQWKGRKVNLCFDSDAKTNSNVLRALNAFSSAMLNLGAEIFTVQLETFGDDDKKMGLDDFLVSYGKDEFLNLPRVAFDKSKELWVLNEEVAYIDALSGVCKLSNPTVVYRTQSNLVNLAYANRTYQVYNEKAEKFETVNAMAQWLKWAYRRSHAAITYAPGEEEVTQNNELNIWPGWGLEQFKKGDCKPFFELVDFIFEGEKAAKEWFLDWLAYPLQNPGSKMFSSVLLWSRAQGTGKTFLGYIIGDIYGKNYIEISEDQLHDSYNEWLIGKQFILGAEITGTDKRRDSDRIKNLITQETITVRAKYQPTYTIPDCANYLFTSNHPDAMFVEQTDRRLLVHEIPSMPKDKPFYKRIDEWRKRAGAMHLAHYLVRRNLKGFDPKSEPPLTRAKQDMHCLSMNDLDLLVGDIINAPDNTLRMGGVKCDRDIYSLNDIVSFLPEDIRHASRIALSKAMRRAGVNMRTVSTPTGTVKLWPLRNRDDWSKRSSAEWSKHYVGKTAPKKEVAKYKRKK